MKWWIKCWFSLLFDSVQKKIRLKFIQKSREWFDWFVWPSNPLKCDARSKVPLFVNRFYYSIEHSLKKELRLSIYSVIKWLKQKNCPYHLQKQHQKRAAFDGFWLRYDLNGVQFTCILHDFLWLLDESWPDLNRSIPWHLVKWLFLIRFWMNFNFYIEKNALDKLSLYFLLSSSSRGR